MKKDKILELFEYRKLPQLISRLDGVNSKKLYKKLINVQRAIYDLDAYLESRWTMQDKILKDLWTNITTAVMDCGYSQEKAENLCKSIRRYQLHEMQLRDNKLPLRLQAEYYYFYKSCDVRLMRQIIYDQSPEMKKEHNVTDWRYFDLVTEVNDDVSDVKEDMETINGNMFMIMIAEKGKKETQAFFNDFLDSIILNSSDRFAEEKNKIKKKIHKWTIKYAADTRDAINNKKKLPGKKEIRENSLLYKLVY